MKNTKELLFIILIYIKVVLSIVNKTVRNPIVLLLLYSVRRLERVNKITCVNNKEEICRKIYLN